MPTMKLTKPAVAKLLRTATGADVITWDSDLAGFGLRTQGASARWIVQYRTADGATRRLTLGPVAALSVDDARKRAKVELGKVAAGGDPSEAKRAARDAAKAAKLAERSAITVTALVERWAAAPADGRTARTTYQYATHLRRHVVPVLGRTPVKDVMTTDVARVKGAMSPALWNRVLNAMSACFRWAVARGLREDNPARGLGRGREPRRIIYLTDDQQASAWAALAAIANDPAPPPPSTGGNLRVTPGAVAALRFMALTGLRPSEACGLTWGEVDLERRRITFRTAEPGKQKRRKMPEMPISAADVAFLLEQRTHAPGAVVFPDAEDTPDRPVRYTRLVALWARVRERADLGTWTDDAGVEHPYPPYVLRHNKGTGLVTVGAPMPVIMQVFGHTTSDMTLRYAHATADAVTAALDKLDAARPSPTGAPSSAVVVALDARRKRKA